MRVLEVVAPGHRGGVWDERKGDRLPEGDRSSTRSPRGRQVAADRSLLRYPHSSGLVLVGPWTPLSPKQDAAPAVHRRTGAKRRTRSVVHARRRALVAVLVLLVAAGVATWHHSTPAPSPSVQVAPYTVQPGDTLWSLATRVAPQVDPQVEITRLTVLNHLTGTLQQGQRLLLPRS